MRRIILPLLSVILFLSQTNAQQLTQGFEANAFPPSGWTSYLVVGTNAWERSTNNSHSGVASAFNAIEDIANGSGGLGEKWLVSPKIYNVQNGDQISFWLAQQFGGPILSPYYDQLEIYITTAGNQPVDFSGPNVWQQDMSNFGEDFQQIQVTIPASFNGQNIYIGFKHTENQGNGIYLDDISAGTKVTSDALVSTTDLKSDVIYRTGVPISFSATAFNNGTNSIASGMPVSYSINGGPAVTVNTSGSLAAGASANISFTGANAFTPPAPGVYNVRVYTNLTGDNVPDNNAIEYNLTVQTPQSFYPYFTDFETPAGWSQPDQSQWIFTDTWTNGAVVNPSGLAGKAAMVNSYNTSSEDPSVNFTLRTPILDFTGLTKPMINFWVSVHTQPFVFPDGPFNDSLQVLVSTDGGATYGITPLYHKSNRTDPKLRTELETAGPDPEDFQPSDPAQWRLEMVDLSGYAGNSSVIVAFRVIPKAGQNVWIDNVTVVNQSTTIYNAAKVLAGGTDVPGAFGSNVHFNTIPTGITDSVRIEGQTAIMGVPAITTNTTAIGPDGFVSAPNTVHAKNITIGYSGNTEMKADFNISFNLTNNYPEITPDLWGQTYVMWRADQDAPWQALTTTGSGSIITASGLASFGEFGVGYFNRAVPVTLLTFAGRALSNSIELRWTTSQEANILSYDIQKQVGNNWENIGNVLSVASSTKNEYVFNDINPSSGMNLYRLRINSATESVTYSDVVKIMYSNNVNVVHPNVPNPVRDYTIIRYELSSPAAVQISVFDAYGRQVSVLENARRAPGSYQVRWEAGNVPSGNYYYRAVIGSEVFTGKMIKLR